MPKRSPKKIFEELQKQIGDFKFDSVKTPPHSKPRDPFGFITRKKILEQDVPRHEISSFDPGQAALSHRAPKLNKILTKYEARLNLTSNTYLLV